MNNKTKITAILSLALVMIATTITSIVWWNAGLSGNNDNDTIDINIGTGNAVTTTVTLNMGAPTTNDTLRPTHIGTPTSVVFNTNVAWTADGQHIGDETGNLSVAITAIRNAGGTDILPLLFGANGAGVLQASLFVLAATGTDTPIQIGTANSRNVGLTITMNEPSDSAGALLTTGARDVYDLVAGQVLTFEITFTVTPITA